MEKPVQIPEMHCIPLLPEVRRNTQTCRFQPKHFKTKPSSLNRTSRRTPVPLSFDHRADNNESFHCFKATAATNADTPAPQPPPGAGPKLWSERQMGAGGGVVQLGEQTGIAIAAHPSLAQVGISQGVGTAIRRAGYDPRAWNRFAMHVQPRQPPGQP